MLKKKIIMINNKKMHAYTPRRNSQIARSAEPRWCPESCWGSHSGLPPASPALSSGYAGPASPGHTPARHICVILCYLHVLMFFFILQFRGYKHRHDESTIDSVGFKGDTRGAPIMPRDAVSRTAHVERTSRHKWVKSSWGPKVRNRGLELK